MSDKRIVMIDNGTGNVMSQWSGGDEQDLAPIAGRTHITLAAGDTKDYSSHRWTGTVFELVRPAPVRVLSPLNFACLFTFAEEEAIDVLADTNRTLKGWMWRLSLATTVNLDHPDVVNGTAYLVSKGLLTPARRTAILAGTQLA